MSALQQKLEEAVTGFLLASPGKPSKRISIQVYKFAILQHLNRYVRKRYQVWYDEAFKVFGDKANAVRAGNKSVVHDDMCVTVVVSKTSGGTSIDHDRLMLELRKAAVPEAKLQRALRAATVETSPQMRVDTVLKV